MSDIKQEIKTISLRDPIETILSDNTSQYKIKTNWNRKGRVPDFILDIYSINELNKLYQELGFYEQTFILKVEENIFFLISILKGIIRYCFNTWSLRYDWDEFDKLNSKIRTKCNDDSYNTNIINSLLFFGDCREHGYLLSFMFETYVINLPSKTIYDKYELVISYNTFYVSSSDQEAENENYSNTTSYDHVLCILKETNKNLLFIDALDISFDFARVKTPPIFSNLHLHYNDMIMTIQNEGTQPHKYILEKAQFNGRKILFMTVEFIDDILEKQTAPLDYDTNKYLCFEIKESFYDLFIKELRSIKQLRRERIETLNSDTSFYNNVRQMSLIYFINIQFMASIKYGKMTKDFLKDCEIIMETIITKTSIQLKGGNKYSSKKIKKTARKSVKKSVNKTVKKSVKKYNMVRKLRGKNKFSSKKYRKKITQNKHIGPRGGIYIIKKGKKIYKQM
jgi:hypothetical protein